jgi:hypothetical protein
MMEVISPCPLPAWCLVRQEPSYRQCSNVHHDQRPSLVTSS